MDGANWRTPDFKNQIIQNLQTALTQGGQTNRSPEDMEAHVFKKTKTKEEYLSFIAKLLVHLREKAGVVKKEGLPQQPGGAIGGPGMPGGPRGPTPQGPGGAAFIQRAPNMMPRGPMAPPAMSPASGPAVYANVISPAGPASVKPSPSPLGISASPSPLSQPIPSPSSVSMATPGNPNSVGEVKDENDPYLEKHRQLQKYVVPLRNFLANQDGAKQRQSDKLKSLLDILQDSSRRVPMQSLLKCELALERLDFFRKDRQQAPGSVGGSISTSSVSKPASISIPTPDVTLSSTPAVTSSGPSAPLAAAIPTHLQAMPRVEDPMCEPLFRVVAAHLQNPVLDQALKSTFRPPLEALKRYSDSVPEVSEAAKKKARTAEGEGEEVGVRDVVQGEIARLPSRYRVRIDPSRISGGTTVYLVCTLVSKELPSNCPLLVTVPESYPDVSPSCSIPSPDEDDSVSQESWKILEQKLVYMSAPFTTHELLQAWESSVRKVVRLQAATA